MSVDCDRQSAAHAVDPPYVPDCEDRYRSDKKVQATMSTDTRGRCQLAGLDAPAT